MASFLSFQTYGETSDEPYIEQKKQCLYYETNMSVKRIKEIAVDVKISKTIGDRTGRRRTTTTVVVCIHFLSKYTSLLNTLMH